MAVADLQNPKVTQDYAVLLQSVRELFDSFAKLHDGTGIVNVPTGAIRWSAANNRFEKFNGTTWEALSSTFAFQALTASGPATFSDGTSPIISAKIGPTGAQQHAIPAVASDTLALMSATQTLANKTLTTPTINGGAYSGTFSGNHTNSGQVTFSNATAPIISAKIGPNSSQQHAIPAVASDTLALLGATQTLLNKDLTDPLINSRHPITDEIQPITASVGSSALTVTLNPTVLDFRSATITSGAVNRRKVASAISLVVPSGATLGQANGVAAKVVVLAIDNGGTIELAVVGLASEFDLSENGVISTTALSASADSANVAYSTTARSNVPYRVVGYLRSTQATAGTWASAPSIIQGAGGGLILPGQVIGVYRTDWTSAMSSGSTSWIDVSGGSITFTPKRADSKLLITSEVALQVVSNVPTVGGALRLVRDGSPIHTPPLHENWIYASSASTGTQIYTRTVKSAYVNSDAVAATTIKLQLALQATSAQIDVNQSGLYSSSITVMEIAQ